MKLSKEKKQDVSRYSVMGQRALCPFRQQQLLIRIQAKNKKIKSIHGTYIYFLVADSLNEEQQKILKKLLQLPASSILTNNHPPSILNPQSSILVLPRLGTVSPWSSKATDIAHVCGLPKIKQLERGIIYTIEPNLSPLELGEVGYVLHDRMTESVLFSIADIEQIFVEPKPILFKTIPLLQQGEHALQEANLKMGLALTSDEINYLTKSFQTLERDPTDVELMMFAQVNSEHCRHKIFNARFVIDQKEQRYSLFSMIKNTYRQHSEGVLSAYNDNAAVLAGFTTPQFFIDPNSQMYVYHTQEAPLVIKVETHNHPTAISPYAGAATGAGGEIRDEAATGRGAKTKAGLVGFSVSHLHIPDFPQPWEMVVESPEHIATPLEIMLEGPIGAAAFNNEFGRPNLCGYFRTFEMIEKNSVDRRGYHKPIMIAGGMGSIGCENFQKKSLPASAKLIVLGGPAMRIGLGGGAASSVSSGSGQVELDFASVQRSNPEMQRRAQEVINTCFSLGKKNPILSIHDVGAGGLSNALPELVHGSERGGYFELRKIPSAEQNMSPLEIWCNEAQERYVLAICEHDLSLFTEIAERERCPFAVIGDATEKQQLILYDSLQKDFPIDMPLSVLLGKPPQMLREVQRKLAQTTRITLFLQRIVLKEAVQRVLNFPCVASKSFLITIGDRTITGLVARDQMVGPWQIPVADVAVTASSYQDYVGEAMSMGERAPLSLLDAKSAARMAVGEAITNIAAARIVDISRIRLSANWMAAAGYGDEDAKLYDAVHTIGMEFCPALGICIPVGKDSLSMKTVWQDKAQEQKTVASPLSLIISAFAPVVDIRNTLTPQLIRDEGDTELILIDLGEGKNRLGGSALLQVYQELGEESPDILPELLKSFFTAIQVLNQKKLLLAYHDRSDGGLLATLCEMSFAGHCGITVQLKEIGNGAISSLFAEELGAVIQIKTSDHHSVFGIFKQYNLEHCIHRIGIINTSDRIIINDVQQNIFNESRTLLQEWWSETSYRLQALRDNPTYAAAEFARIHSEDNKGLRVTLTFNPRENIAASYIKKHIKPKVAILREQGVNGHMEMAAAFDRAGFLSVDVHMTDIISGKITLKDFHGLAACGGFSYGDVLGAGTGWAQSILFNDRAREQFATFFHRINTFALGVCNGCQMMAQLQELIPGSDLWPRFTRNKSEQFEARFTMVEIPSSPSIFFQSMAGSRLPIAVAHGEGFAQFSQDQALSQLLQTSLIALRYIDHADKATEHYPDNPNGSPHGITGLTTPDGRVTILMPHPERVFRTVQWSWYPHGWEEDSPWMKLFWNARRWVG